MKVKLQKPKITNPLFYNKNGTLTRYSFVCGYIEVYATKETVPYYVYIAAEPFWSTTPAIKIELYAEGCVYVIDVFKEGSHTECIYKDTVTEARKAIREIIRSYKHVH